MGYTGTSEEGEESDDHMKVYQHADKEQWEENKSKEISEKTDGSCPTETFPWLMKDISHSPGRTTPRIP